MLNVRLAIGAGLLGLTAACHRGRVREHPVPAETVSYLRTLGCGDTAYAREMLVGAERRGGDPKVLEADRNGRWSGKWPHGEWPNPVELARATPRYAVTDPAECAATLARLLRRSGAEIWRPTAPLGHARVVRFALVRFGPVELLYTRYATSLAIPRPNGKTDTTTTTYELHLYLERNGRRGAGFSSG